MFGLQSEQVLNLTGTQAVFEAVETSRALIHMLGAALQTPASQAAASAGASWHCRGLKIRLACLWTAG